MKRQSPAYKSELGTVPGFDLSHAGAERLSNRGATRQSPSRHCGPLPYFPGIIPACITPFGADDTVQLTVLRSHIRAMIDDGVHGIVVAGSTGEMTALDDAEWLSVVKTGVEAAAGRVPVIAGAGACSTRYTIKRCLAAAKAGADGVMVVPPFYGLLTQPEVFAHFSAVAEALAANAPNCKLIIYNNPGVCHTDILPRTIVNVVATHPDQIAGVKESSGVLGRTIELAQLMASETAFARAPRFQIICGCDTLAVQMFALRKPDGSPTVSAWIAPPANVLPRVLVELYEASLPETAGGNPDRAEVVGASLQPLLELFEASGQYVALSKYGAGSVRKVDAGRPRAPIADVSQELTARLDRCIADVTCELR